MALEEGCASLKLKSGPETEGMTGEGDGLTECVLELDPATEDGKEFMGVTTRR